MLFRCVWTIHNQNSEPSLPHYVPAFTSSFPSSISCKKNLTMAFWDKNTCLLFWVNISERARWLFGWIWIKLKAMQVDLSLGNAVYQVYRVMKTHHFKLKYDPKPPLKKYDFILGGFNRRPFITCLVLISSSCDRVPRPWNPLYYLHLQRIKSLFASGSHPVLIKALLAERCHSLSRHLWNTVIWRRPHVWVSWPLWLHGKGHDLLLNHLLRPACLWVLSIAI